MHNAKVPNLYCCQPIRFAYNYAKYVRSTIEVRSKFAQAHALYDSHNAMYIGIVLAPITAKVRLFVLLRNRYDAHFSNSVIVLYRDSLRRLAGQPIEL
jgi:hypothetical protein